MKRIVLLLLTCLFLTISGFSDTVYLNTKKIDVTSKGNVRRTLLRAPSLNQNDHAFTVSHSFSEDFIVRILDGESVVYTAIIPAGSNQIILPSFLEGIYEFDLINGDYCYWGEITL